jgi:hypothetical protein
LLPGDAGFDQKTRASNRILNFEISTSRSSPLTITGIGTVMTESLKAHPRSQDCANIIIGLYSELITNSIASVIAFCTDRFFLFCDAYRLMAYPNDVPVASRTIIIPCLSISFIFEISLFL